MEKKNPAVLYGEVIAKCWEDEAFKKRFVEDPESVLAEAGIPVEEGLTYKVIEAPKLVKYIVLPEENVQASIQDLTKNILSKADKSDEILPAGTELRIIQNTEDTRYLVLPASPKTLTQTELQLVFGGGDNSSGYAPSVLPISGAVAVTCPEAYTTVVECPMTNTAVEPETVAVVAGIIVLI